MRSFLVLAVLFALGCPVQPSDPTKDNAPTETSTTEVKAALKAPENLKPETLILTDEQIASGYIQLFDGESTFGWHSTNDKVEWKADAKTGVLSASGEEIGLLLTDVRFQNYELEVDAKCAPGSNTGLFVHCKADPKKIETDFYEINIADEHPEGYTTGGIVLKAKSEKTYNLGDWMHFKIIVQGSHIQVLIDGEEALDFNDTSQAKLTSGYIALQKRIGDVEFKNIILKPLNLQPLFEGKSLDNWQLVPGGKASFDVTKDQTLLAQGGAGFLETIETYQDFLLQLDAKTLADNVNSGVFFRALQGTEKAPSHGYEMQIDNSIKDGNPKTPANAGSGAIFRRNVARRVVSKDFEWSRITLVADGLTFMAWVNGYPVTDWTDTRAASENPREGSKKEAGHLSLQGHDPGTKIEFKKIEIQPYE